MRSLARACLFGALVLGCTIHCTATRELRQVISRQEIQQLFGILPPPTQAPALAPAFLASSDPATSPATSFQGFLNGTGVPPASAPSVPVTNVVGNRIATQQPLSISGLNDTQSASPTWQQSISGASSIPPSTGQGAIFQSQSPSPVQAGTSMTALSSDSQGALYPGTTHISSAASPATSIFAGPASEFEHSAQNVASQLAAAANPSEGPAPQITDSRAILPPAAANPAADSASQITDSKASAGQLSQLTDNAGYLLPNAGSLGAGQASQLTDSSLFSAAQPPVASAPSIAMSPSPAQLPFGDRDPFGDAAASRGGAMPARVQPNQATQGNTISLGSDVYGTSITPLAVPQPPAALASQALQGGSISLAAGPSPGDAAAPQAMPPPAASPTLAMQASVSTDTAAPQATQGSLDTNATAPSSGIPPTPDQDTAGQPSTLPPVTGSTQGDQQPTVKVYQYNGKHWREIAIAAIVILLLLVCTVVACVLCQRAITGRLERPAAKPSKNGRYKGMKEFEMPEIKSTSWGMP